MTKGTIEILVIMFAYALGGWKLCVSSIIVLAIGEWQLGKEAKRFETAKEKAEYNPIPRRLRIRLGYAEDLMTIAMAIDEQGTR